ncbi:MerR family transcriptional regulator [Streptomyces sp. NPDC059816]|uniref:MerR family transcriptional regulator n=1 Tax=Streptomyces sp. NPDC059816 TaxID=3346960 RepID=UPI003669437C
MRIGEIASVVGVTTRAIRHYHHLGLLPEPERRANGYRDYALRHAVALARIRRLTELGLGLPEVRDVIADDAGRELAEVLTELDEDLAGQEVALREQRRRVGALLTEARAGRVSADGPVSPQLTGLLGELAASRPDAPASPMAVKDRELLILLDSATSGDDRAPLVSVLGEMTQTPGAADRAHEVYALLDDLAEADAADPRVDEAARALAALLPPSLAEHMTDAAPTAGDGAPPGLMDSVLAEFAPAQAAAVHRAIALFLADR